MMRIALAFKNWIDLFLFGPDRFNRMGLLRIIAFIWVWNRIGSEVAFQMRSMSRPSELLFPTLLIRVQPLPYPLLSAEHVALFGQVLRFSTAAAIVGVFCRPAMLISAYLQGYALAARASWGYYNHDALLVFLVLVALATGPGSTLWSVDSVAVGLYRRWRDKDAKRGLRPLFIGRPRPKWGFHLILLIMTAVYFGAGVSKLRIAGVRWVDGNTIGYYLPAKPKKMSRRHKVFGGAVDVPKESLWKDGYGVYHHLYGTRRGKVVRTVGSSRWMLVVLSIAGIGFELLSPLLLMSGWMRNIMVAGAIGMHIGIEYTMHVRFNHWIYAIALFFDPHVLIAAVRRWLARRRES